MIAATDSPGLPTHLQTVDEFKQCKHRRPDLIYLTAQQRQAILIDSKRPTS